MKLYYKNQPYGSYLCGQTCLSMITCKSIDLICDEMGKYGTTHIKDDLMPYLTSNGYEVTYEENVENMTFEEIPLNSIVRIQRPNESGHFIIKTNDGLFLDPLVGEVRSYNKLAKPTHYLRFA